MSLKTRLNEVRVTRRIIAASRTRFDNVYRDIAHLVARHGSEPEGLIPFEYRVFSQNGEDGILAEIFRRVGVTNRYFVEFGASDGVQCNTSFLADVMGWSGLLIEGEGSAGERLCRKYRFHARVTPQQAMVTASNVNELFDAAGVPECPDLVCIDVDGNDYWIFDALRYRARVVTVEYNGTLPLDCHWVQPRTEGFWDGTDYYGCSLAALESLALGKGYRLVHTDLTGTNAFFVQEELAGRFGEPVRHSANQFFIGRIHPEADPLNRPYLDLQSRKAEAQG
jgi:hypothetical protein